MSGKHDPIISGSNQTIIYYLKKLGSYQRNQIVDVNYFLQYTLTGTIFSSNCAYTLWHAHFIISNYNYIICIGLNIIQEFANVA
jgi:hypothetical protein